MPQTLSKATYIQTSHVLNCNIVCQINYDDEKLHYFKWSNEQNRKLYQITIVRLSLRFLQIHKLSKVEMMSLRKDKKQKERERRNEPQFSEDRAHQNERQRA